MTFLAVYENGVLRPLETIDVEDGVRVRVEVRTDELAPDGPEPTATDGPDAFLESIAFDSGLGDLAERFDNPRVSLRPME